MCFLGVFQLGLLSRTMTKLRISALSKLIITHNGSSKNRTNCTQRKSRCAPSYDPLDIVSIRPSVFQISPQSQVIFCLLSFFYHPIYSREPLFLDVHGMVGQTSFLFFTGTKTTVTNFFSKLIIQQVTANRGIDCVAFPINIKRSNQQWRIQ